MKTPDVKLAREGDVFLFMQPNFWGKGKTPKEAISNCMKAGGRLSPKEWLLYSAHPKSYCEEIRGDLVSPKGHEPIKLADRLKKKK